MLFELVIFDCDGVLVDSEPIANRVLCERLAAAGLVLAQEEVMLRFVGRTRAGCLDLAAELLGRDLPAGFAAGWDAALFAAFGAELKPRGRRRAPQAGAGSFPACARSGMRAARTRAPRRSELPAPSSSGTCVSYPPSSGRCDA